VKLLRLLVNLLLVSVSGSLVLVVVGLVYLGVAGAPLAAELAQRLLPAGQLQIAKASGGLFGPLHVEGLVFENAAARVELDRLDLDWRPSRLRLRQLRITQLDAGHLRLILKPTPATPPEPLLTQLPLRLRVDDARLAQFELVHSADPPGSEPLAISAIEARLVWRKDHIRIERLAARHALSGPLLASGELVLEPQALRFEPVQLSGPGLVVVQGRLGLMGSESHLGLGARNLRWPLTGTAQLEIPQLRLGLHGVLTEAVQARINVQGRLRAALPPGIEATAVEVGLDAIARLGAEALQLEHLRLGGPGEYGGLSAQGRVQWAPALAVEAEARLEQLDPGLLFPDFPGQLNGLIAAHTVGDLARPQVQFSGRLADSQLRGYPLALELRGSAESHQGETRLALDSLDLRSGSARLHLQGRLLPLLDAQAELAASDLRSLLPELSGALQLKAQAQGAPANPTLRAEGSAQNLRYQGQQLARLNLNIDYDPKRPSKAALSAEGLVSGDTQMQRLSLNLDGRAEQHHLALSAQLSAPKSSLELGADGGLDLAQRRWRGRLSSSHLQPPVGPAWTQEAPAAVQADAALQQLESTCWRIDGSGRACLKLRRAPPLLQVEASLAGIHGAQFNGLLPEGLEVETVLDGQGLVELRGRTPTRLELQVQNSAGRLRLPGAPDQELQAGQLSLRQEAGQWRGRAELHLDHVALSAEASLPVRDSPLTELPLSGRVRLSVPELGWVEPLLPGVTQLAGQIQGDFSLGGSLGQPLIDGQLALDQGQAHIEAAGILLQELRAELRGGFNAPLQISASARSGEGRISLRGQADLSQRTTVLDIDGELFQVANLPDARVWVSPQLHFERSAEAMNLSGEVLVPRAEITPRKLGGGVVSASSDQVIVGEAPREKSLPLAAAVKVRMGEAVRFAGFGLKARIGGDLTVIERPGTSSTQAFGELQLLDAVYKAYGQDLQLSTGRILFSGPINKPSVDLRAVRKPNDEVTVTLHVRGTLDKPSFDLSSSPVMTQEQQLGWLLLGRPLESGGDFSAAAAALSLGLAGGDQLAKKLTRGLGIDTISLGAEAGESSDQARFTVGKYLSPKLYVSYGVGLFANGNVLRLLYDLGKGFKLRTESGQEAGGDLLYSRER
jgi:translocation and assembly module TamB